MAEDISARLKRLRKEKKMTQAALATAAAVTQGTIGNLESGLRGYGESIVDIARALGVSPDYLRCETNSAADAVYEDPSGAVVMIQAKWPFPNLQPEQLAALGPKRLQMVQRYVLDLLEDQAEQAQLHEMKPAGITKVNEGPSRGLADRLNQHKDFGSPYHPQEETNAARDIGKKKGK